MKTTSTLSVESTDKEVIIYTWNGIIRLSKAEAKKLITMIKPHVKTVQKYKNEKVQAYNRMWDSQMELNYYEYLREEYGAENVIIQPKFVLQDKIYHGVNDPRNMAAITYSADFQIGNTVVDVKGMLTQQGKMRIKMLKARYPDLELKLITQCPKKYQHIYGQWIELQDLEKERKEAKKLIKTK